MSRIDKWHHRTKLKSERNCTYVADPEGSRYRIISLMFIRNIKRVGNTKARRIRRLFYERNLQESKKFGNIENWLPMPYGVHKCYD